LTDRSTYKAADVAAFYTALASLAYDKPEIILFSDNAYKVKTFPGDGLMRIFMNIKDKFFM